jgi:hypothetical protein
MNSDILIQELSLKAAPVKPTRYGRVCAGWMVITLLCLVGITSLHGLRPDFAERMAETRFALELLLNGTLIVLAGLLATNCGYPDRARSVRLRVALGVVFIGYSGLTLAALDMPAKESGAHGVECLACILSYAVVPGVWIVWQVRRLASTQPQLAGACAALMALATGCLGVRLVEVETQPEGLLLWHYIPLLVLSAAGILLGRKIFRW